MIDDQKLEKVKILLQNSSFGLFLEPNAKEEAYLSKEALRKALEMAGKKIFTDSEKTEGLQAKWQSIVPSHEKQEQKGNNKIRVRIPKNDRVAEINYTDDDTFLNLIVTAEGGEIDPQNILVEKMPPELETVFCFFENEKILDSISKLFTIPKKEGAVMVSQNDNLLTEKTAAIIRILDYDIYKNKEISTLLLASLITETDDFTHHTSKDIFNLAGNLLENGADQEKIKSLQKSLKTNNLGQMMGRALARTRLDEQNNSIWTFLTQTDFQKTKTSPSRDVFLHIIKIIKHTLPEKLRYLILWEKENKEIGAFIFSDQEKYLEPLASKLGTALQSTFFISPPYKNFSEAEQHLRKLIKDLA